jgi:ABC-2 type transport system permease protein
MTIPALAGTPLAGTSALARLAFRRDRIMLPVWVYVITAAIASNSYSLNKLYPTAAARADLAASGGQNPALVFLYGRLWGDSLGAVSAWRYGVWAAIFAALMSIFLVVRHTRADEEAGRLELVGSAAVGRLAALTAGLLVAVAANVVLTVLLVIVLIVLGLPVAGSVAFALAITTCGLVFAAVAALAAQLAASARAARGIALGVLGAAYLLRAVGDASGASGVSWLAWLSPLGWTEQIRPYTADRWPLLALPLALTAAATAAAYVLAVVRDHGAGLLPDRPGRPAASAWLRGPRYLPLGLAWRLQRGTLYGWALGFAFTFAASGAAAEGIGSLLGGSAQLRNAFTRLGGEAGITDAYLAAIMSLAGLAAAAYATSAVLRLRTEETGGQAEPLLATATSRIRWGLSHVVVVVAGTAALLAVAGVAAGLGYGLRTGSAGSEVARLLGAAMVQLPASLAVAGAAVVLFGLAPRASVAGAWTVLGVVVLIALFGQVLQLSQWVLDVSPFTHVPKLPGAAVTVPTTGAPLLWLSLAAVALAAAGLAALRRRDIG